MLKISLDELKDDKYEEKWENGEKSSKRCDDRKVVEKHRHISRSTRSRFSCLKRVVSEDVLIFINFFALILNIFTKSQNFREIKQSISASFLIHMIPRNFTKLITLIKVCKSNFKKNQVTIFVESTLMIKKKSCNLYI